MVSKLHLYSGLQQYARNQTMVEVSGTTVGECLNDLVERFPDLKPRLFDARGALQTTVFFSINLQTAYREELSRPLNKGEEIYLILMVPGG